VGFWANRQDFPNFYRIFRFFWFFTVFSEKLQEMMKNIRKLQEMQFWVAENGAVIGIIVTGGIFWGQVALYIG
jgi:hypothetical protein